jgi:hypothetical protein
MTKGSLKVKTIKGLILFCLFTIMGIKSCTLHAQASREQLDELISKKVKAWDDSVRKLKPKNRPLYLGCELSLACPQYILKSRIPALDGLHTQYLGTNLGGVASSAAGKLKATVGMYYSEPSVPYTMDMVQGAVSGSLYLLRLKKIKYHSVEPYATVGLTRQLTKFYGDYLPAENGAAPQTNYSLTEQPLVGKTGFTQMNLGVGVEYQLESCSNVFIHLFAEAGYGVLISSGSSNRSFSGTTLSNPATISLGLNFGISK